MRCLLSKYNNEITPPRYVDFQRIAKFIINLRDNETTSKDSLLISINTNFNHPTFNFTPSTPLLPFNPSHPFPTSLHHSITSSLKKMHQCVFIFIGIIDTSLHHFITPLHPLSLYTFPDIINNLKQKIS